MKNKDVLDDVMVLNRNEDIMLTIRWWEKKRLAFNVIAFCLVFYIMYTRASSLNGNAAFLLFFLIHIWLNIVFTIGWVNEVLIRYFFNKKTSRVFSFLLFILVCLILFLLPIMIFGASLTAAPPWTPDPF